VSDPLALARDIRKRLHLIADPSVRLDMEAMCDAVERLGTANAIYVEGLDLIAGTHGKEHCNPRWKAADTLKRAALR
jgi:hypothetical protein